MKPDTSRRRLLLWTAAGAVVVRLLYFAELSQSAFFAVPLLDEAFYDQMARALLAGVPIHELNPAFRPMAYPAFLALIYRAFGEHGTVAAVALQHLCGILTAVLVAELGRRLFRHWGAGAAAAALYVLAAPPLFFEGQLLITTLTTLTLTGFLTALPGLGEPDDGRDEPAPMGLQPWAVAGLLLGLTTLLRPNALPVAATFAVLAWWNPWRASLRRRLAATLVAGLAMATVLGAAGLWQARHFGSFHWLPGSGGVNFYLGNKAGADGMIPRQDRHTSSGDLYRDSVQIFAETVYAEETGAEPPFAAADVSRFWYVKTLRDMASRPVDAIGRFARKGLLLLWNHEIPNNKSFHFVAEHETPLLGYLPVRFALLLALAGPGWLLARRRGDRALLLWTTTVAALYAAGLLLFFVNARFRIPLWPVLAVWAGGGLWGLGETLIGRRSGRAAPLPKLAWLAAPLLLVLSTVNWLGLDPETPYRDYFFRSLAHQHKGNLQAALADARRATELAPQDPAAHFQLGTIALHLEDLETAEAHLGIASLHLPDEPRVFNNLGIALERQKKFTQAYMTYRQASEVGPNFSAAFVNLALLELRAGLLVEADQHVARAEWLGDRSIALQCARSFLEIKRGRIELGKSLLRGATERDPDLARRLVEEHSRPLLFEPATRTPTDD